MTIFTSTRSLRESREFADEVYAEIMALDSIEDYNNFYNTINSRIIGNTYIELSLKHTYGEGDALYVETSMELGEGASLAYAYFKWLNDMQIYVEKDE